ncbi:hypothetical protein [Corynebacterium sp. KPL2734]|uniref:hypothetical protein n=1 Tax=Corynebacterium sp. KPL2734 TaxID=3158312 RepID=UPI0032ECA31C
MKRKVSLGIAAAALAMTAVTPAAFAQETATFDNGIVNSEFSLDKKESTKKDPKEQAELTGKHLDNAKKGVETAKGIVDTLNGLGGLFGLNGGK